MENIEKIKERFMGIMTTTIVRFPLTAFILLATTTMNAIIINTQENDNYFRLLITFVVGASLYIVFQMIYERFLYNPVNRLILMVLTIIIMLLYYIVLKNAEWNTEVTVKTTAILFILFIAFLWIPSIKSRICFNKTLMATFKAFFIVLFFFGVVFIGVSLILMAIDQLIFNIDGSAYAHSANIIFILFAPLYFLSLIPFYPKERELEAETDGGSLDITEDQKRLLEERTAPTKFLVNLISFVIIPVTAVFTVILLLYIILNITSSFWTDNLLEPMLVTYSITVIIAYLLASRLDNKISFYFRKIFPKVLVPVVLFQTISSILRTGELGITYGRYYVILFGVFATMAGIIFSIVSERKNGLIAPILILFTFVSVVPPVDAFTTSRISQTNRLEKALRKNDMLEGNTIIPNASITEDDKKVIINSVGYLGRMNDLEEIEWLNTYQKTNNMEEVFGFPEYESIDKEINNFYFCLEKGLPIPINGYDYLLRTNFYNYPSNIELGEFLMNGINYSLKEEISADTRTVVLMKEDRELLRASLSEIFNHFENADSQSNILTIEDATFVLENEAAALSIIVDNINLNTWENGKEQSMDCYIMVRIK